MFIAAALYGMQRAEVRVQDIHEIVNIDITKGFLLNQAYHLKTYTESILIIQ